MMNRHITFWLITLILLFSNHAFSFDLFNPDRGKPSAQKKIVPPPRISALSQGPAPNPFPGARKPLPAIPKPPKKLLPQKDFILRGTSVIGDKRTVVLKGPDNKEFIQRLENNQRTQIKGYANYYLLNVAAREVQIEYPSDAPCRDDKPQQGLKCNRENNGKTVILALKQGKALPPKPQPAKPSTKSQPAAAPATTAQEARQRREEARQKRQELYKNFKRRVIKDEDVPPGMRVVRTPFGDRLVPIK